MPRFRSLVIFVFLIAPWVVLKAQDLPRVRKVPHTGTALIFPGGQVFTLPEGKGLLGPSKDPGSQVPFANAAGSIVAVNEQPVTKSSYLHIYVKGLGEKYTEIADVNRKLHDLASSPRHEVNAEFVRVEKIVGRKLLVQSIQDFPVTAVTQMRFWVTVSPEGLLEVARPKD